MCSSIVDFCNFWQLLALSLGTSVFSVLFLMVVALSPSSVGPALLSVLCTHGHPPQLFSFGAVWPAVVCCGCCLHPKDVGCSRCCSPTYNFFPPDLLLLTKVLLFCLPVQDTGRAPSLPSVWTVPWLLCVSGTGVPTAVLNSTATQKPFVSFLGFSIHFRTRWQSLGGSAQVPELMLLLFC